MLSTSGEKTKKNTEMETTNEILQYIIIILFITVIILAYMVTASQTKIKKLTRVINKISLTPI